MATYHIVRRISDIKRVHGLPNRAYWYVTGASGEKVGNCEHLHDATRQAKAHAFDAGFTNTTVEFVFTDELDY